MSNVEDPPPGACGLGANSSNLANSDQEHRLHCRTTTAGVARTFARPPSELVPLLVVRHRRLHHLGERGGGERPHLLLRLVPARSPPVRGRGREAGGGSLDVRHDGENKALRASIVVDQVRARRAGVTSRDVALWLQTHMDGLEITEYREGDIAIPVRARSIASRAVGPVTWARTSRPLTSRLACAITGWATAGLGCLLSRTRANSTGAGARCSSAPIFSRA